MTNSSAYENEAPRKKRGGKVALIAIFVIAAFFIAAYFIGSSALSNIADKDFYTFGDDQIVSVKSVVGKRKINRSESSVSGGVTTQNLEYESAGAAQDDLKEYLGTLINEKGFQVTQSFNLDNAPGTAQLAANSVEIGKIILLDIEYSANGYKFIFTKAGGTLTINEP